MKFTENKIRQIIREELETTMGARKVQLTFKDSEAFYEAYKDTEIRHGEEAAEELSSILEKYLRLEEELTIEVDLDTSTVKIVTQK